MGFLIRDWFLPLRPQYKWTLWLDVISTRKLFYADRKNWHQQMRAEKADHSLEKFSGIHKPKIPQMKNTEQNNRYLILCKQICSCCPQKLRKITYNVGWFVVFIRFLYRRDHIIHWYCRQSLHFPSAEMERFTWGVCLVN